MPLLGLQFSEEYAYKRLKESPLHNLTGEKEDSLNIENLGPNFIGIDVRFTENKILSIEPVIKEDIVDANN